jgi:glycerophosphoryl diester phosphodiesterase
MALVTRFHRRTPRSALLALAVILLAFGSVTAAPPIAGEKSTAATRVAERRTLVIAHRGDSKAAPENTLAAFESAVRVGVDFVELDYHHSSDGVPIVIHDETLDRTTDAVKRWGGEKLPVVARSAAELVWLDAGTWFDAKFARQTLPTLDKSLDTILPSTFCLVERKAGDAATLVKMLREKRAMSRVVVQAFDWKFLADCHKLEPKLVLGALGSKELRAAQLDEIVAAGATAVGWKGDDLRQRDVDAVHARGLKAWAYTINEPEKVRKLLAWGVDGIITDVPVTVKPMLEQRASR